VLRIVGEPFDGTLSSCIGSQFRIADAVKCGTVGINTGLISNEVAPFGGIKQSGIDREVRNTDDELVEVKYVRVAGI
jgi:succinate-semialdehyde dehydrogenase/glutarate-semialdehyde dehydrogenase